MHLTVLHVSIMDSFKLKTGSDMITFQLKKNQFILTLHQQLHRVNLKLFTVPHCHNFKYWQPPFHGLQCSCLISSQSNIVSVLHVSLPCKHAPLRVQEALFNE